MEGKAWRIESPGASITENIEQATLALRLGIAVNAMRAVQQFFYNFRDAPGPAGERDRLWAFLIAMGYLKEAIEVLRPKFRERVAVLMKERVRRKTGERHNPSVYAYPRINDLTRRIAAILLTAAAGASCRTSSADPRPPIVQPGAPGESGKVIAAGPASDLSRVQFTAADVTFMQGMIGHHAQAVEMTGLLKSRTSADDMRKLALRIEVSQADEIKMMQRWLQVRGQDVPDPHAMHMHGAMLMPGMLTEEQMSQLAAAKGTEFDRLFLEGMIRHHDGALVMVKELLAIRGAAQESEIFAFVSDVDADQRMEMERMGAMLKERQK